VDKNQVASPKCPALGSLIASRDRWQRIT